MTREQMDKVFLADCILAGGAIRELAELALSLGWSPRRFRVSCEYALIRH